MGKFNGTKGQWKIGTHFSNIVTDEKTERPSYSEEDYESEKKYYGGYLVCESVSKKADAKLIAAAPELLEALIEVVRISDRNNIAWNKAKEVIKKATE